MSASRSIDNFQTLSNTNLGLEQDRAVASEHTIAVALTTYSTSNDAAVAAVTALASANYATVGAQITVINASIASIRVTQAVDEGHATAEVSRAEAAESALTVSVASEITRAEAAEAANAAGVASNVTAIAANVTSINSLNASRTTDESHIATNTASIVTIQATQVTDESHITSLQSAMTALGTAVNTSTAYVAGVLIAGQINTNTVSCAGPMLLTSSGDQWGKVVVHIDNTSSSNGVRIDTTGSQVNVADLVLNRNNGYMILRNDVSCVDSTNAGGEFKLYNQAPGVFNDANGAGLLAYYGLSSSGIYNGDFHVRSGSVIASTSVNVPLIECDTGALTLTATHAQYGTSSLSLTNVDGNDGLTLDNTLSTTGADIATFTMKSVTGLVKTVYEKRAAHMFNSANAADGEYRIEGMHGTNFYSGTAFSAISQGSFSVTQGSITAHTSLIAPILTTAGPLTMSSTGQPYGSVAVILDGEGNSNGMTLDTSQSNQDCTDISFKSASGASCIRYEKRTAALINSANILGEHQTHITTASSGNVESSNDTTNTTLYTGAIQSGLLKGSFTVSQGSVTAATSFYAPALESTNGTLSLIASHSQFGSTSLNIANKDNNWGLVLDASGATHDAAVITLKTSSDSMDMSYVKQSGAMINSANATHGEFRLSNPSGSTFFTGAAGSGFPLGNLVVATGSVTATSLIAPSISYAGPITISSTSDPNGQTVLRINNTGGANGIVVDTSGSSVNNADIVLKNNTGNVICRFEGSVVDSNNLAGGEYKLYNQTTGINAANGGLTLWSGVKSSGIYQGNFSVPNGTITDINDQDVTLAGSWSNFSGTNACQASMRFVRKGSVVTVSLASFIDTAQSNTAISTYSLAIPAWAAPPALVECSIVVATNGLRSAGCCLLCPASPHNFSLLPFNANWGSAGGGINQATCFSYLV